MCDSNFQIKRASARHIDILTDFNLRLALETENRKLDENILRASIRAIIDDERKGVYLLVTEGEEILAQIMYVFEWSTWRNANYLWLTDLYIEPKHRKRGIFNFVIEHVMKMYRERKDIIGLRFYVDKGNGKVVPLYKKMGWKESNYNMWEMKKDGVR